MATDAFELAIPDGRTYGRTDGQRANQQLVALPHARACVRAIARCLAPKCLLRTQCARSVSLPVCRRSSARRQGAEGGLFIPTWHVARLAAVCDSIARSLVVQRTGNDPTETQRVGLVSSATRGSDGRVSFDPEELLRHERSFRNNMRSCSRGREVVSRDIVVALRQW